MLVVIAVGCLGSLLIGRGITKPVVGIVGAIKRMAEGDLDLVLPGLGRKDEIGEIAAAVEALKRKAMEKARCEADEIAGRLAAIEAAQQQKAAAEIQASGPTSR